MDYDGNNQPLVRFDTGAQRLREELKALRTRAKLRPLYLTMEAGPLSR
jgi:hypothetical protein